MVIQRHIDEYPPFEVLRQGAARVVRASHAQRGGGGRHGESKMYGILDHYQKEGYHSLLKIARQQQRGLPV
jgi:hypothetical protein